MQPLQTIIIAGFTTMAMATFSSIATFLVNRYLPRLLDHAEKKIKKPLDK
jgi:hypothetical protein